MTTDYDAPRTAVDDGSNERTDELAGHRPAGQTALTNPPVDDDELAAADSYDLPGADLSSEEISVQILAAQADEFTCASCFLVRHRSQIALERGGQLYCVDCEG
ncbi:dUTPase [Arthrobacter sp. MN05-02]|nr:dUTPase [Arthrobacter sp. MN05-02]